MYCFVHGDAHASSTCKDYEEKQRVENKDTEALLKSNTKPCPKCGIAIEKKSGCNHMKCPMVGCKASFCWLCLQEIEDVPTPAHYKPYNLNGCPGKQFQENEETTCGDRFGTLLMGLILLIVMPISAVLTIAFSLGCFWVCLCGSACPEDEELSSMSCPRRLCKFTYDTVAATYNFFEAILSALVGFVLGSVAGLLYVIFIFSCCCCLGICGFFEEEDNAAGGTRAEGPAPEGPWTCPRCTFDNPAQNSTNCQICSSARPAEQTARKMSLGEAEDFVDLENPITVEGEAK